jgi:proteasome lid subunit RPN8/RPN11
MSKMSSEMSSDMSPELKLQAFHVDAAVEREIRRHGEETYPHECCGALVGSAGRATATVALPNTTEEGPRRRFLVRPSDYRLAEQKATEIGGELLGFYHSHPDHPSRPSQYDLDHAWPTFAYIIVAVAGAAASPDRSGEPAKAGDMTVWFLKEDRSTFEKGELNGN